MCSSVLLENRYFFILSQPEQHQSDLAGGITSNRICSAYLPVFFFPPSSTAFCKFSLHSAIRQIHKHSRCRGTADFFIHLSSYQCRFISSATVAYACLFITSPMFDYKSSEELQSRTLSHFQFDAW